MSSEHTAGQPLLVVIAPTARQVDGESVRIAKDVLRGGTAVKIVLPENPTELDRVLAHRGRKQPVVIGDDRALQRVVQTLHRQRELTSDALGMIPVGGTATVALARALGIPTEPVAAARAVLGGRERTLDLLVDDSGGVVLGGLCIPGHPAGRAGSRSGDAWPGPDNRAGGPGPVDPTEGRAGPEGAHNGAKIAADDSSPCSLLAKPSASGRGSTPEPDGSGSPWWSLLTPAGLSRTARTLVRAVRPGLLTPPHGHRLRVEADGKLLVDIDRPVGFVAIRLAVLDGLHSGVGETDQPTDGMFEVLIHPPSAAAGSTLRVRARTVTVAGRDFSYATDSDLAGPVRSRTWTVRSAAWRLTVPAATAV